MRPYYQDEHVTVLAGDCLEVLRSLPDASVHAVVTDPPYGLEFMGKEWDGADGFRRSLNPADAGRESVFGRTSRTSPEYRTASKAKAGMTGTGYTDGANRMDQPSFLGGLNPKCLSCGRWQRGGNPCTCDTPEFTNERLPRLHSFQEWCEAWARECLRVLKPGGHMLAFGGSRTWHRLAVAVEDAGFEVRDSIAWLYGSGFPKSRNLDGAWQGWGTALKPAFEPIVVARKPLTGTVAANVLEYGTGALNIDATRVGTDEDTARTPAEVRDTSAPFGRGMAMGGNGHAAGRWPTNVLLDDTQEPVLRLKYNLPVEVERTIRESFGASTDHLPAVRDEHVGAAEQGRSPEVLLPQVPGRLDVGEPDGREGTELREATHPRSAAEDAGQRPTESREGQSPVEGRHIPHEGLRDGARGCADARGAGAIRSDADSEPTGRVHAGAPASGSSDAGPTSDTGRARAPRQRREGRQPAGESGSALRGGASTDPRRGRPGSDPAASGERRPTASPLEVLRRECPPGWWHYFDVIGHRREGQAAELDQQSGITRDGVAVNRNRGDERPMTVAGAPRKVLHEDVGYGGSGGASRFFPTFRYEAKAPAGERPRVDGVAHPTVKPLDLMRWLVRLVTPPGGTILDPFAGSGTTLEAALIEGFQCIGIERETDYLPLIRARLSKPLETVLDLGALT